MATFVVTPATTVRPPAPSDSAVCAKLAFTGSLKRPRREVRNAKCQELVARVDPVTVQPGDRPSDRDRLHEGDQRDAGCRGHKPFDVLVGDRGDRGGRQAARNLAHHADGVLETEQRDEQGRRGGDQQLARPSRPHPAQREERHQHAEPDGERVDVDAAQAASEPGNRRLEGARRDAREPEEIGSCAAMMTRETAAVKPTSTGRDNRSARNASRSIQASSRMAATSSARTAASPVARATSPWAIGAIAAAVRIELVDVGPTWAWRIDPASPYASPATAEAYRPTIGGRPARPAYARPLGTAAAQTASPAPASRRRSRPR